MVDASGVRELVVTSTIDIPAPPEQVWAVLADAMRWPDWSGVVAEVSHVSPDLAVGETLAYRLVMGPGVPVRFVVTVISMDHPHVVSWSSRKWMVVGTRTFRFEPIDGGVRVTDHKHFAHPWAPLAWFYPVGVIRRMSEAFLADLSAEALRRGAAG